MRGQKGITLVALIITIVVLMILAGVAISSIQGENGILGYARNSATAWNKATQNEATTVQGYLDYLKENTCEHKRTSIYADMIERWEHREYVWCHDCNKEVRSLGVKKCTENGVNIEDINDGYHHQCDFCTMS